MKNSAHARSGVTLLEMLLIILIVELFVIAAVLVAFAFAVLPEIVGRAPAHAAFSESDVDNAKIGAAKFNLHTLRAQIELYESQHEGRFPSSGLVELLEKTNADGTSTPPAPYGPYLHKIPANPFNNSSTVVDTGADPPRYLAAADVGYLYNTATGGVWVNDPTTPFADQ